MLFLLNSQVTRTASGKQLSLIKDLTKASLKTCQPPRAGQSAKAETKGHPTYNNKDWTFDKMTLSPPGTIHISPLCPSTKRELRFFQKSRFLFTFCDFPSKSVGLWHV